MILNIYFDTNPKHNTCNPSLELWYWADVVLKQTYDMTDEFEFFYASRDLEKARTYVDRFEGGGIFGSYEDAARDPRVDAMYFLTPHDLHLEHARLAARGSKHILVEKPITRTMAMASK